MSLPNTIILLLAGLFISGCATVDNRRDPLESMNRAIFNFNEIVDDNVIKPVAQGYKAVVPDPVEMVISNFFSNLSDVVVTGNSLLQLKFTDALASGTRILINTTFGMLGMIDIASDISAASDLGIAKRNEDFGQTLGYYGVPSGPYLVLPFFGPSSVRDTTGLAVDAFFMDPVTAFYTNDSAGIRTNIVNIDNKITLPVAGVRVINIRAQFLGVEKILEEAALDKYEFVRDAYFQRRNSLIHDGDIADTMYHEGEY